jgi:omega-6 fatty acid desaturase (delta-12 desaturase)
LNVFLWYGAPYLWVNAWLVFITYLQHSDIRVPHYTPEHWNFVRGALSTVDRDFGPMINWWLHHIHDSHVVHHLFSTMPFYNAIQVTRKHIKPIVGPYYLEDSRPLHVMLWESWRGCRYIVPSEGVAYFKK